MVFFEDTQYFQQLHSQAGARKLTVSTLGESHGLAMYIGAAIQYACWRHYHADIAYDHRSYANGGSELAVGATTTSGPNGLLAAQIGQFAARPTDIAFICSGYNDQPHTAAALDTLVGNVAAAATALFAAGAKFVVIAGMTPLSVPNGAAQMLGYNFRMRQWCSRTAGALFLDVSSVLADRQNAGPGSVPFRDIAAHPAGTYHAMTMDGTHWSRRAIRGIAPLVADIFRRICGERTPRLAFNAGPYDPVGGAYANILGDTGNMMGTAGLLNFEFHTGVAGTAAARLSIAAVGAGFTVTPAIVTGPDGERRQRITLGGTVGASGGFVEVSCTPAIAAPNAGAASRMLDLEGMIDLTGVTGLSGISLRPPGGSSYHSVGDGSNSPASAWPDGTTESLFAYTLFPAPVPAADNPPFAAVFFLAEGKAVSGTIDLYRLSAAVVRE